MRAADRALGKAEQFDTHDVQLQLQRYKQLEQDEAKARAALDAAKEEMTVESMRVAIALAEALGGDEDPMKLGLKDARRSLVKWETRDAAADALRRALEDTSQITVDATARTEVVYRARAKAREAGVAEVAPELLDRAERVEKRLGLLQIEAVSYDQIGPPGWKQTAFAEGGGSDATMHDITYNGEEMAAKVINLKGLKTAQQKDSKRKIQRELAALKRAQGANVVGVLGVAFSADANDNLLEAVLLMEKAPGLNLSDLVQRETTWPLPCMAQYSIALGIAKGMAHLHCLPAIPNLRVHRGLIHHDLKSANVMVSLPEQPGGAWGVKLIDFGEAERTGATITSKTRTSTASVGTDGYTAPEQDVNWTLTDIGCDELSEAYSFAVIVWEMATRQAPAKERRLGLKPKDFVEPWVEQKISAVTSFLVVTAGKRHPEEREKVLGKPEAAFKNIVHFLTSAEPRSPLEHSWRTCLQQELSSLPSELAGKVADAIGVAALGQSSEQLIELLSEEPSGGLECAVRTHAVMRLERFFDGLGVGGAQSWLAKARAVAFPEDKPEQSLEGLVDELGRLWQQVTDSFLVPKVAGPQELRAKRAGSVLLVVRCGFNPCASGFLPNGGPCEGFTIKLTAIGSRDDPNTKDPKGHDFSAAVDGVARDIRELVDAGKKVLVMAGSRGGVFFAGRGGLWDRMQLPSDDAKHVPKVACLMLNVNPNVAAARLPESVNIVFTYGSQEGRYPLMYDDANRVIGGGGKHPPGFSVFIRERGAPSFADPPPESLEGLVNGAEGSRLQRFAYFKGDNSSNPSTEQLRTWRKLLQGPEEVATWPRPPADIFLEWPPGDITRHKAWPHLQKPKDPPPFLGAAYYRNKFSKFGSAQQQYTYGPFGDDHDPASVYQDHCLLRLIDAALSPQPEPSFVASYPQLLTDARRSAEQALGLSPEALICAKEEHLNAFAAVPNQGLPTLAAVPKGKAEWKSVEAAFYSRHRSDYHTDEPKHPWSPGHFKLEAIERVQNLAQLHAFRARKDAVLAGLAQAGVKMPAASCMRWGFHGAEHAAIESIVTEPVAGFKGLLTERSLWGKGIYFGRDALYSYYATGSMKPPGFCEEKGGVVKMMLCLLVTGLPCAADQDMKLLPYFKKPMRYHSSVDSLSNPQIFVLGEGVAVYPAYVISFRKTGVDLD